LIERKSRITGDCEVIIESDVLHFFLGFPVYAISKRSFVTAAQEKAFRRSKKSNKLQSPTLPAFVPLLHTDNKKTRIPSTHVRPNLPQTFTNPQNAINKQAIRRSLDLEIPEERIRPEQAQHFIQYIVALGVGFWGEMGGVAGEREGVGGAADFGAEGEEGEVAN